MIKTTHKVLGPLMVSYLRDYATDERWLVLMLTVKKRKLYLSLDWTRRGLDVDCWHRKLA